MMRRECRIKCRGNVRPKSETVPRVGDAVQGIWGCRPRGSTVGRLTGWTLSRTARHGPRIRSLCMPVSPISIFTFPLTVFISKMSDGEYLSRLKSGLCLSVWNAMSVANAGFYEFSKLIYVFFKVIRSYDWADLTWLILTFCQ